MSAAALALVACAGNPTLAADPAPVRKSVKVGNLNLSYLQWGADSAPPMLLIPGAGGVASTWATVAPALARDYRVVSIEVPGRGFSDWDPAKQYNVATNVAVLKEAVRLLGMKNLVVVGHSQGGNEAVVYAAEDAANVVALVAAGGGYMMPGSTRAAVRAEQARLGIAPPPPPKTEFASWDELRSSLALGPGAAMSQAELDNRFKQLADGRVVGRNDPELAAINEADAMMQPAATAPFAQRVKAPAMVIRGGNDNAFAKDNAELLTGLIPQVRLAVSLPGAGHSLYRDKPAEFVAALRGFLTLLPPAAAALPTAQTQPDQRRSYRFADAGEDMPYRVDVPPSGAPVAPRGYNAHGGYGSPLRPSALSAPPAPPAGALPASPPASGPPQLSREEAARVDGLSEKDTLNVLEMVTREYGADRSLTFLMGNSMGSNGVMHLASKYPDRWLAVAPSEGASDVARFGDALHSIKTRGLLFTKKDDAQNAKAAELIRTLAAQGIDARLSIVPDSRHESAWYMNLPQTFEFFDNWAKKR